MSILRSAALSLIGLVSLIGCSGLFLRGEPISTPAAASIHLEPTAGTLRSATGCRLDFRLYKPNEHPAHDSPVVSSTLEPRKPGRKPGRKPALVILGHGFLRSQERMSGLAKALATQGIPVATLDFCNMRPWDGRHQQNGLDMIALAEHLKARVGAGQIVYSGFSAGGLAALVAARNDPNAIGAVTLDLVDAQGIGLRAVRELDKPLLGLAGEPTNCNAGNNARAVFAASDDARVQPIPGAGHCDFEAPTDALCELLCEDPDQAQPTRTAALREQIIATATDAIESMIEDEPSRPETAG